MNKKEEQNTDEPIMVILHTLEDDNVESRDKKTFEEIEKHLVDLSRSREFDCLFMSETKKSAKALSHVLRGNLEYKTEKPYHDEDGWITHAVKLILYSELKDTLRTARETVAMYASELIDWMVEADK